MEVYTGFVAQFLKHFENENIELLDEKEIRNFLVEERDIKGYSTSYQNQMLSAIKYYYRSVYGRLFENHILPRPKRGMVLPRVISKEEVERIFLKCLNEKHRMILYLLYGFGLRVSEVVNLKISDIDFNLRNIFVYNSKGMKDRVLPIPKVLIGKFEKYMASYRPNKYFICGQTNEKYNTTSIQKIVKGLAKKASIDIVVTPHVLRHCYATHMLEKGTDLRYIQVLLGHKSSKTTEIYTHVSINKINELANPMDDIKI